MRAGPAGDADHAARRDAALVVAVECATATSTCFCTSMGTGPEVAAAPISSCPSSTTGSSSAPAARPARPSSTASTLRPAIARPARPCRRPGRGRARRDRRAGATRTVCPNGCAPRSTIHAGRRSPSAAWPAPTARSSARPASAPASASPRTLTASRASTDRHWDSCFSLGFGRVAGDANFRPKVADRYRQWLTHKFSTWWDQFGSSGCVGCGRCIAWCPVGIDVREELAAIAPPTAPAGPIPWPLSPPEGRAPAALAIGRAPRSTRPRPSARSPPETVDTATLALDRLGSGPARRARPGPVRDGRAAGLRRPADLHLADPARWPRPDDPRRGPGDRRPDRPRARRAGRAARSARPRLADRGGRRSGCRHRRRRDRPRPAPSADRSRPGRPSAVRRGPPLPRRPDATATGCSWTR